MSCFSVDTLATNSAMRASSPSRSMMGHDPVAYLRSHQDRSQIKQQFTEDIKTLISHGGPSVGVTSGPPVGTSRTRTRSPGLAAGAALVFGATSSERVFGATSSQTTLPCVHPAAEANAARLQTMERVRKSTCPFDDHAAFGASPSDRAPVPRMPEPSQIAYGAGQASRSLGKHNRDIAQKIGAGSPFDAPEASCSGFQRPAVSSSASTFGSVPQGTIPYADARAEANVNKLRMRGAEDMFGGYLTSDSGSQAVGVAKGKFLPPRAPSNLLPQAQMKVAFSGGSAKNFSSQQVEYMNAQVMQEANRERNGGAKMQMSLNSLLG